MRICLAHIFGVTAYSQSKHIDPEVHPKREKEKADDYDKRLWREHATYYGDTDEVAVPAMALKMGNDEACKRLGLQVTGRGKTTYAKFFVAGQICEDDVPLGIHRDDLEYIDIWANPEGVRGGGKRVKRRFPYIHAGWKGVARFALLDEIIPNEIFERVVVENGRLIGIGRFRPEKGGLLGRFRVDRFEWQAA